MNRSDMFNQLHNGVCDVKFIKASGASRRMKCTLQKELIPAASKSDPMSQKKVRAINEEVLPVWDIEARGWRSFRVDSVKLFNGPTMVMDSAA
jgi:hypothetical protein